MLLVESQNPVPVRLQIRSITISPPPIFALPESAAGNRWFPKVWSLASQPDRFKRAIEGRIAQLKARQIDAE